MRDPYKVIKCQHITEKARMLEELQGNEANPSVAKCKTPKVVFIVDKQANKSEIAAAVETLFAEQKVKVTAVNTLIMKPKRKKRGRGRGRPGKTASQKKAIVSLEKGDRLDTI